MFHTYDKKMGKEKLLLSWKLSLAWFTPSAVRTGEAHFEAEEDDDASLDDRILPESHQRWVTKKNTSERACVQNLTRSHFLALLAEIIIRTRAENAISQNWSPPQLVYSFWGWISEKKTDKNMKKIKHIAAFWRLLLLPCRLYKLSLWNKLNWKCKGQVASAWALNRVAFVCAKTQKLS